MSKQVIGIGAAPNDGNGDPLRTAFDKANDNFTELYDQVPTPDEKAALAGTSGTPSDSNRFVTAADKTAVVADIPARDALAWGAPETGRLVFVVDAYIDTPGAGQGDPEVTAPVVGRTYIWTGTAFVPVEPSETGWKKSGITTLSGSPTIKGEVNIHGPGDEPVYAINSSGRFYWEAMHPELVSAADHGLSLLNWLTVDGAGAIVKGSDLAQTLLGVVSTVESTSVYSYVTPGGRVTGLSGLTPGSTYYAQTNGTTSTTPSSKPVFKAVSATAAILFAYVVDVPDATPTVKGLAKLFSTFTPGTPRTDGSVDEVALLSALYNRKIKVTKSGHGYTVGKVLTFAIGGGYTSTWAATNKHVLAGIVSDVIDANNFLLVAPGGYIDTLSGLTGGQHYYVQGGNLVIESAVTSTNAQLVLFSLSSTSGFVVTDGQNWRRMGVLSHQGSTTFTASGDDRNFHRFHTNPLDLTLNKIYEGFYARGWTEDSKVTLVAGGGITINVHGNGGSLVIPERCFIEFVNVGSIWWVYVFPSPDPVDSTGTAIAFDRTRKYGTTAVPITGDLTLDSTGLKPGMVQLIIHNDSGEPNYPTEFKKAAGSLSYVPNVDNFIYAHCVESAHITITITQTI